MAFYWSLVAACILYGCFQPALSSYLGYPRINFAGQYSVDTNYINNDRCNYRMDVDIEVTPTLHNYGSNSFRFYETKVTSVVYSDGTLESDPSVEPIIDKKVVNNVNRPFAKLVDLDVDCQLHSAIYGMNFGIQEDSAETFFYGDWTPSVICQGLWPRVACFTDVDDCLLEYSPGGESFSGQSSTTLTNIEWNLETDSRFLRELRAAFGKSGREELAVRISQSAFHYGGNQASLGMVVGTIGIPSETDTLSIPGQRMMYPTSNDPLGLDYDLCEKCIYKGGKHGQGQTWMGPAPFEVDMDSREVRVDLSYSLVMDNSLNIRNIGQLQFGVFDESLSCVVLIGDEIVYNNALYPITTAIYNVTVDSQTLMDTIANNPLVVVQVVSGSGGEQTTGICSHLALPSTKSSAPDSTVILLQEDKYFLRPKGNYVGRLDQTDPSNTQEVYVTTYGRPAVGVTPTVNTMLNPEMSSPLPTIPSGGVIGTFENYDDSTGIATFKFERNANFEMPVLRNYGKPVCENDSSHTLPIDGQVYFFYYSIEGSETNHYKGLQTVFLSHSDVTYTRPYTWVRDVGPILTQYARITPIMKTILDLGSYKDMILPHNLNLMKETLILDITDPSYMPTTRDLSPAKREMILEWLYYPLYEHKCKAPPVIHQANRVRPSDIVIPDRCEAETLDYEEDPEVKDATLSRVYRLNRQNPECFKIGEPEDNSERAWSKMVIPDRPLFRKALRRIKAKTGEYIDLPCTKMSVTHQLQTALRLEWATLPVYLTSLYSIAEGCNLEIYNLIRGVVMQEMLHFALVGNMIIALGDVPKIDFPNIAPSYPGHLPGCVLPDLYVTLERLSLTHIHDVLMEIELPKHTKVAGDLNNTDLFTIGAFYDEIKECIDELLVPGQPDIFDETTEPYQVQWKYWGSTSRVGDLIPILNTESAIEAINTIVSQGEGATELNPKDIEDKTLAHFFRFEEIYCENRLKKINETSYAYSGYPIPFNELGVAQMRPNPLSSDVPPNTVCYTESRNFHVAYRNFLRKLQEVFGGRPNGNPKDFFVAVELMEALQLNAKRLMWIQFNLDDQDATTCGPVWDYEWKGV